MEATGVLVFKSLADAIRAGYQVESSTPKGYIVRTRTDRGFVRAVVDLAK